MRRDEIMAKWEALSPRERDAWVAEVIFGSTVHHEYSPDGPIYLDATTLLSGRRHIRNYTTDISAAWAAAENFPYHGVEHWLDEPTARYVARIGLPDERLAVAYASTAPEAICLAALIAKLT